jgi:hypothetical protein
VTEIVFPTATFTLRAISGLPARYGIGDEITFGVSGDLRIRDIVRP